MKDENFANVGKFSITFTKGNNFLPAFQSYVNLIVVYFANFIVAANPFFLDYD